MCSYELEDPWYTGGEYSPPLMYPNISIPEIAECLQNTQPRREPYPYRLRVFAAMSCPEADADEHGNYVKPANYSTKFNCSILDVANKVRILLAT